MGYALKLGITHVLSMVEGDPSPPGGAEGYAWAAAQADPDPVSIESMPLSCLLSWPPDPTAAAAALITPRDIESRDTELKSCRP